MEDFKEFITPTRFSLYGYIVAVSNPLCGTILFAVTGSLRASERRNIHCNVGSKSPFDKNFLRASCFDQYEQKYNSPLPLYGFPLLSFSMLTIICIVYSWCCVKSRVEEVEEACKFDAENPRPRPKITTRRVFSCYFTQLIVRLTLGSLFVFLQKFVLYPSGFPIGFLCELKLEKSKVTETNMNLTNSTFIECQNSMGSDKAFWTMMVFIVNILLAFLVAGEAIYLIYNLLKNKAFMQDSEFCQRYLFNQRKTSKRMDQFRMNQQERIIEDTESLEPLIPPTPGENEGCKKLDDVYVDLIIHTERSRYDFDLERMDKLGILEEYLKSPQNSIRIKTEELILPNEDSSDPRKILILGGPGVGKTLLCKKFLRDLSKGEITEQGTTKFHYMYLFHFRHFNSEDLKSMSLQTLLSHGRYSEGLIDHENFQSILEHPEKILLVFDGLDEFKYHERCMEEESEHAGNGVADVMPFSALYVKLVQGKILSGATVLTTSRPHVMDSVRGLKFDRTVEMMGFSKEKVEEYCTKFFQPDTNVKERIWQHMQENLNLLYLCYIPVNCFIVCSLLEKIIKLTESPLQEVTLPTTLTEIYERALRMFIFRHHPEYKGKILKSTDLSDGTFSISVKDTLSKLELLAVKGIEERRLVFESKEVKGMENCGLLNRMPDVETAPFSYKPQFCFIHLTMQEFVAARCIVKMNVEELKEFISSKSEDAKWHLVIQFVAGLLKDKEIVIKNIFVKLLQDSLISNNQCESLVMMKCLYELNDINIVERAAGELKSNSKFTNKINLQHLNLTTVDCTAIVHFLRHIDTLECLDISRNHLGTGGCSELAKLIAEGGAKKINFEACGIDDQSFVPVLEAMKSKTSKLLHLILSTTNDGFSSLCDTLVDKNCKLTRLKCIVILDKYFALLKLSSALKHKDCKLTKLHFSWPSYLHERISLGPCSDDKMHEKKKVYANLFSALVSENCKLTELVLDDMPHECLSDLFEALKHENCKLTKLKFRVSILSDAGLLCCCEALQHVNFNFTEVLLVNDSRDLRLPPAFYHDDEIDVPKNSQHLLIIVGGISITDVGISHLCNAIKNENCKLTKFSIFGCLLPNYGITNKGVKALENALTHENSKLEVFRLCRNFKIDLRMPALQCYPNHNVDCRVLKLNSHSQKVLARKTVQHVGLQEEKDKAFVAQEQHGCKIFDKNCLLIKIER